MYSALLLPSISPGSTETLVRMLEKSSSHLRRYASSLWKELTKTRCLVVPADSTDERPTIRYLRRVEIGNARNSVWGGSPRAARVLSASVEGASLAISGLLTVV
jgi:hypothetical protein